MRDIRFDEYGWRARFDDGFDHEGVRLVADALARTWKERQGLGRVLVGYDTRHHASDHAQTVAQVLAARGFEAIVSDRVCPTPALAWAVAHDRECVGAVMLTASASSHEYGGIQARLADGGPMSEDFARQVSESLGSEPPAERGSYEYTDVMSAYLDALRASVDGDAIGRAHLSVVCDPMYGAGQGYLGDLLADMGCKVHTIHGEHVQDFRGLHPRPREPWVDECECEVRRLSADIGLVLDGDGDRLGIVDESGSLVSRHDAMPLLLGHLVWGRGHHGRVVSSVATTRRMELQAASLGCEHTRVPVGFGRTYDELTDGDVIYAVEERGGICVPSHLRERDGLYAALIAVEMCARSQETTSDNVRRMTRQLGPWTYESRDLRMDGARVQMLRNLLPGLNPQEMCGMRPVEVSHADGLRMDFADGSWLLVRPARSQPYVRLCAEASVSAQASRLISEAAKELVA